MLDRKARNLKHEAQPQDQQADQSRRGSPREKPASQDEDNADRPAPRGVLQHGPPSGNVAGTAPQTAAVRISRGADGATTDCPGRRITRPGMTGKE